MIRIQKILSCSLFLSLCFMLSTLFADAQTNKQDDISNKEAILSLSFDELPNTIQVMGKDLNFDKFSNTLKVTTNGITQFQGSNLNYTFTLTLPNFDFTNGKDKTYTNETSHFFDAKRDAALLLTIGNKRFGTLFRSKEKENILSKLATTDYQITTSNRKGKGDSYYILIRIKPGSVLQESSETLSKTKEATLHIAQQPPSHIKITNPQPALPKVESFKFNRSSELIKKRLP